MEPNNQNKEGNLVLVANNISNGIPVHEPGKLLKFPHNQKLLKLIFWTFKIDLKLTPTLEKKRIAKSDRFVKVVASVYLDGKKNLVINFYSNS